MADDWSLDFSPEVRKWIEQSNPAKPLFRCDRYKRREVAQQMLLREIENREPVECMWVALEHAGRNYLRRADRYTDEQTKAVIEKLLSQAVELRGALTRLLPERSRSGFQSEANAKAYMKLWSANERLMAEAWARSGGTIPKDAGFVHLGDVGFDGAVPPTLEIVLHMVDHLAAVSSRALPAEEEETLGRPRNEKLRGWIVHVSEAWDRHVGKKRTVTFARQQPTSDFARFVWWALEKLGTKDLPSLPSVLREYRSAGNERMTN